MTELGVVLAILLAAGGQKKQGGLRTAGKGENAPAPNSAEKGENAPVRNITAEEARRYMERHSGYALVDVRMPEEYSAGHIPGALNIPLETILDEDPAGLPDHKQVILVYCHGGARSAKAAMRLARMGYTGIYCFGGMDTWKGSIVK